MAADFTFEFPGLPPLGSDRAKVAKLAAEMRGLMIRSGFKPARNEFMQIKLTCYAPPASGLSSPMAIMDGLCQALVKARVIGSLSDLRDIRYRRHQGPELRCVVTLSRPANAR